VLGRIVIGPRQLAAGGLLGEPAKLDDARPDPNVTRQGQRSAAHGIAVGVRRMWRWHGHSAKL
jgi:hypothetical protein